MPFPCAALGARCSTWAEHVGQPQASLLHDVEALAPTPLPSRAQVTGSLVYRTAASKLYPVISSYADPALDRITASPYYSAVLDHLKPQPQHCAAIESRLDAAAAGVPIGAPVHALACVHC